MYKCKAHCADLPQSDFSPFQGGKGKRDPREPQNIAQIVKNLNATNVPVLSPFFWHGAEDGNPE